MASRKTAARRTQDAIDNSPFAVPGQGPRTGAPGSGDSYPVETPWGRVDAAALWRGHIEDSAKMLDLIKQDRGLIETLLRIADGSIHTAKEAQRVATLMLIEVGALNRQSGPKKEAEETTPAEEQLPTYADQMAEWGQLRQAEGQYTKKKGLL